MKCDWNLFLDILNEAISSNINTPMVFTNGAVYNGSSYTPSRIDDRYEFQTILTSILCIRDYSLADVRILENRAAVVIERITPKGHTFTNKTLILKTIKQGISSESAITDSLGLKQYTVNYYLEQFENSGLIKGSSARSRKSGELEYKRCILTSKGKVALDDFSLLLDESSNLSNKVNQNYYAPVYGVAGNIQGSQNIYSSEKILSLAEKEKTTKVEQQSKNIIELISGKFVDFTKLKNLLEQQKWKEADLETNKLMLKAAGLDNKGYLSVNDIDNFPSKDLRIINQLWTRNSDNKFGFSIQKEIYQSLGGTKIYDEKIWNDFGYCVGWKKGENWQHFDKLIFSLDAVKAHLPLFLLTYGGLLGDIGSHLLLRQEL